MMKQQYCSVVVCIIYLPCLPCWHTENAALLGNLREGLTLLPDNLKYHLEAGYSKWHQKSVNELCIDCFTPGFLRAQSHGIVGCECTSIRASRPHLLLPQISANVRNTYMHALQKNLYVAYGLPLQKGDAFLIFVRIVSQHQLLQALHFFRINSCACMLF